MDIRIRYSVGFQNRADIGDKLVEDRGWNAQSVVRGAHILAVISLIGQRARGDRGGRGPDIGGGPTKSCGKLGIQAGLEAIDGVMAVGPVPIAIRLYVVKIDDIVSEKRVLGAVGDHSGYRVVDYFMDRGRTSVFIVKSLRCGGLPGLHGGGRRSAVTACHYHHAQS